MTPERWQKIGEVYQAVLEREPKERADVLRRISEGDADLRREVEALLAADDSAGSFMSGDAIEDAARMLADEQSGTLAGQTVGRYQVLELVGQGGMGEVYLAEDTRLKRKVALKLLPPHFLISRDRVNRFEQEARAISALNHPNIVTIHEVGRFNGSNFIVTEFIEGHTLRELTSERDLDVLEAIELSIQIANALDSAHAAGIIHRDIKPENIMVRRDGYIKVLDFGLAKLAEREPVSNLAEAPTKIFASTQPGLVMGSTSYMSPEQTRAESVDERTDIWSLGVVLYEMLTGRTPFEAESPSHVVVSIMEKEPPLLSEYLTCPAKGLQRIIDKALRKNRDERYQTVKELSSDLKSLKHDLERSGGNGTVLVRVAHAGKSQTAVDHARATSSAEYLVNEIKQHKVGTALIAAIVTLVAVAVGYSFFVRAPAETAAIDSLAVLPFVNVDNDPNKEYLAEGISDSIINNLSQLPNLRVKSLNSVLRYNGKTADPQAVGRELQVSAVLTGRLTQRGDDLLITTELIDVRDNHRLWGEQYNRKFSDLIAVQSEIAQQISEKLRLRLTSAQQQQIAQRYTDNPEAYGLFMMGFYNLRRGTARGGKEEFEQSIDFFQQAIKIDPNYALAYTGLFKAYFSLGLRGFWLPTESRLKAEWAALKAVELDDSLADAHEVLGVAKESLSWDWTGAEKEMLRALELNPNRFGTNFAYATFLVHEGRADEAIPYARRAQEIDPSFLHFEAFVYLHKRDWDKVIELHLKAREGKPETGRGHYMLAEAYIGKGMYEEGTSEMQKVVANDNAPQRWDRHPILAYAYAVAGRRAEALKILNQQKELAKKGYISPYNFAIIYTGLDDKDRAFEYLNKAYEEKAPMLHYFPSRPMFDPLHSDPRFAELVRKMNLTPERFLKS